jgi:hypothetical protein
MKGRGWKRPEAAAGNMGTTALFGCLLGALLASSVAVVTEVRTIDIGPKVGDILVFQPGAQVAADWEFAADTRDGQARRCILTPNIMMAGGGSLVVEQRRPGTRMFEVHWAGRQTNAAGSDCGSSADLVIAGQDLQLLGNAVGGAGVTHKTFPAF